MFSGLFVIIQNNQCPSAVNKLIVIKKEQVTDTCKIVFTKVWPFFPRRMSKDTAVSQRSQRKFKIHFKVRRLCPEKEGTYYSE